MSPDDVLPEEPQAAEDQQAEGTVSGDAPNETPTLETLTQALAAAQEKTQENWDRYIRTQAELENLKRRQPGIRSWRRVQ